MSEYESSWAELVKEQYVYTVDKVAAALLPGEGKNNQCITASRELKAAASELRRNGRLSPEALVAALEPHTTANMSEIVAYAFESPRGLIGFTERDKRGLLRVALQHDIAQFKLEDDGRVTLPPSGEVFPSTVKPAIKLALLQQRLEELDATMEIVSGYHVNTKMS